VQPDDRGIGFGLGFDLDGFKQSGTFEESGIRES